MNNLDWFADARYGMFIHYGLYSIVGHGEWAFNREAIPVDEYRSLKDRFTAENFDPTALCDLAVRGGMRYINLTTMHHDGFRLYDTKLSDFKSTLSPARRDLVAELVSAARERGLRVALYHSLNNWIDKPDSVDALESPASYEQFIASTFARIEELVRLFNPIDVLWYDGWWPFNAQKWQGERMNDMVRKIQPHILFNGRNGLPGDFGTPEQHLSAPKPWRPFEGCVTLNGNWGFHSGDHDWKSPWQVIEMLATCAQNRGNLLLNIGPRGDGAVPEESVRIIEAVGAWLKTNGEAIFDTDFFTFDLQEKGSHRGDWHHHGPITARGNHLYLLLRKWPGPKFAIGGLGATPRAASLLGTGRRVAFSVEGSRVVFSGLPAEPVDVLCTVLKLEFDCPPTMYLTGGLREPRIPHPHYDPCPSDIAH